MDGMIDMFADQELPKGKTCGRCLKLFAIEHFAKNSGKPDGYSAICKNCQKIHYKKWEQTGDNLERESTRRKEGRKENPKNYLYIQAKSRAKSMGRAFNIEAQDIVIPERCPVFGEPIKGNSGHWFVPSVDEIVYGLGYVKGNVQVISRLANTMKHKASPELLRQFANWIHRVFPIDEKQTVESMMFARSNDWEELQT